MRSLKFPVVMGLFLSLACIGVSIAQPAVEPGGGTSVARGNTEFAVDLYRQLATEDGNLFFSPYSISTALAMTYGGARGETASEMAKTLHFNLPPDRLHTGFAELGKELRGDKSRKYSLHVANRLWGQKNFTFLPEFLKLTEDNYKARLKDVDFIGAAEEARQEINAWVEAQTNDKIKELIKPKILTADTRLVLTNAIYFKASWSRPFDPKNTKPGPFELATADKAKVQVPMMQRQIRTRFLTTDAFQAIEIPYRDDELSMLVFLPKMPGQLATFEKTLTGANLEAWQQKMSNYIVTLSMPKFKVTAEFQLNDQLKKMGMNLAFSPNKADFSGMTTEDRLFIKHILHKAFVDVNETGTEAAASTVVAMQRVSASPSNATLNIDHPFVYLIRDNRTGSILFMGRVVDPR